ncbi:MAG: MBL fold metallo-hydrolase [Celeribacter marinus]
MIRFLTTICATLFLGSPALSQALIVHDVAEGVWAIEGPAEQRNAQNLGNNATFGLIETEQGAVLVDTGGSRKGAEALHAVIATLTDHPVTHVINTGGQDHRWIANAYWQDLGATVIASQDAVRDQSARQSMQMTVLSTFLGDALEGTDGATADITFATDYTLSTGGRVIELHHPAGAHTPGDTVVWLPQERVVFTGDIVYVGRILGVMDVSNSAAWLDAFAAVEALDPVVLVPGHGPATTLAVAQADTRDYLANLRDKIGAHIDAGGDIIESVMVDQSAFSYLDQFDALAGRNAQAVFEAMEWE